MQGGGESLDQLYERCTSSLERIGRKHKGMVHVIEVVSFTTFPSKIYKNLKGYIVIYSS